MSNKLNEESVKGIWKELRQPDWSPVVGPFTPRVRADLNEIHKKYGEQAGDALRGALRLYAKDEWLRSFKGATLNFLTYNRSLVDFAEAGFTENVTYDSVLATLQDYADKLDYRGYEAFLQKHRLGAAGAGIVIDGVPYAPILQKFGDWAFKAFLMKEGDIVWVENVEVVITNFTPEGVLVRHKDNPDYTFSASTYSFSVKET